MSAYDETEKVSDWALSLCNRFQATIDEQLRIQKILEIADSSPEFLDVVASNSYFCIGTNVKPGADKGVGPIASTLKLPTHHT